MLRAAVALLADQQRRLRMEEAALGIAQEALAVAPLPLIGIDPSGMIALANGAASRLLVRTAAGHIVEAAIKALPAPGRFDAITLEEGLNELREIKREIVESRGLIIKTNNLTNALSADLKGISRRQISFERRAFWNSAGANLLFVVVVIATLVIGMISKMDWSRIISVCVVFGIIIGLGGVLANSSYFQAMPAMQSCLA